MGWLKKSWAKLMEWLDQLIEWVWAKLQEYVQALWDMITDGVAWFFGQIFGVVLWLLEQLDLSPILQAVSEWGNLPTEIINVLGLLGIGQAAAIMTAALIIRLILQLIPFVRLGS